MSTSRIVSSGLRIEAIFWPGDSESHMKVGTVFGQPAIEILRIEAYEEYGPMAAVPWLEVTCRDASGFEYVLGRFCSTALEGISYFHDDQRPEPPTETKKPDETP